MQFRKLPRKHYLMYKKCILFDNKRTILSGASCRVTRIDRSRTSGSRRDMIRPGGDDNDPVTRKTPACPPRHQAQGRLTATAAFSAGRSHTELVPAPRNADWGKPVRRRSTAYATARDRRPRQEVRDCAISQSDRDTQTMPG